MLAYNIRDKNYYKLPQILVVGNIPALIKTIVNYGFFRQSIHIYEENIVPKNCLFVISETIPPDWNGEIVFEKDFIKKINSKKMNTNSYFSNTIRPIVTPYSPTSHGCRQCGGS
jgi:hypothetical protein